MPRASPTVYRPLPVSANLCAPMELAAAVDNGLPLALIGTAFFAGLRHGFDIDHIAAIADITSSQENRKRSLRLATTYALGHMLVLLTLGTVAILAGSRIPQAIDSLAGRVIGGTLIALGIYVVYSLIRFRRDFRMRSRWMLVIAGVRRGLDRFRRTQHVVIEHDHPHDHDGGGHAHAHLHREQLQTEPAGRLAVAAATHSHTHTHVLPVPSDPFTEYGTTTSFLLGMVHGVGAETPTQVLLFSSAAGLAGSLAGVALLVAFVVGLFLGNSILAVGATFGFSAGKRLPLAYLGLAGVTALISVYVGVAYVLERPEMLPPLLGG